MSFRSVGVFVPSLQVSPSLRSFACLCPSLLVFACLCASLPAFACLCVSLRSLGVFVVFR